MRVFVFTYDRFDSISTSPMLEEEGIDHIVLCHTEEQRDGFVAGGRVRPERLVVTGAARGLAYNRNHALEMMEDGEWAMFLVDDLKDVSEIADYDERDVPRLGITIDNQKAYPASLMKKPISMAEYLARAEEVVAGCEAVGAYLGGFCGIDNPVFRDAKWRFNVLADGRAWVVKKSHLRFDEGAQMIDDLCWTAQNIQTFGVVVVNQWVLPDCKRYTAGAFGSIEQRLPQKLAEAKHLTSTYPGLITYKRKAGWPDGSHVVLRRTLKPADGRRLERAVWAATRQFAAV